MLAYYQWEREYLKVSVKTIDIEVASLYTEPGESRKRDRKRKGRRTHPSSLRHFVLDLKERSGTRQVKSGGYRDWSETPRVKPRPRTVGLTRSHNRRYLCVEVLIKGVGVPRNRVEWRHLGL